MCLAWTKNYYHRKLFTEKLSHSLNLRQTLIMTPTRALSEGTVIVIMIVLMFRTNSVLAIVTLLFSILDIFVSSYFSPQIASLKEKEKKYQESVVKLQLQMVCNKTFFQSFDIQKLLVSKFKKEFEDYYNNSLKAMINLVSKLDGLQEIFSFFEFAIF